MLRKSIIGAGENSNFTSESCATATSPKSNISLQAVACIHITDEVEPRPNIEHCPLLHFKNQQHIQHLNKINLFKNIFQKICF
jgi:hypothetical protein